MKGANGSNCSAQKLVEDLLGNNFPPENLPALKYGRDMIAKEVYINLFEKEHRDTSYSEWCLFLDESKQYLGVSPDLLIECLCCGKGVLELSAPTPWQMKFLPQKTCNILFMLVMSK